jgi:hypothetical protein
MSGTAVPQVRSLPTAFPASFGVKDGSLTVFIRGSDSQTYQKSYSNSSWTADFDLVLANPFLDISSADFPECELLVRTAEYEVVPLVESPSSSSQAPFSFTLADGWPGGYATSGVETISQNETLASAYMIGFDGILYSSIWSSSQSTQNTIADGWTTWSWFGMDDNATADWYNYTPSAAIVYDDTTSPPDPWWYVFGVRKYDNGVWYRCFHDGKWSPAYATLGGPCMGRPVVVVYSQTPRAFDLALFVRGGDGRIWYVLYKLGVVWSEWKRLGDFVTVGESTALAVGDRVEVFARSSLDQEIWYTSLNGASGDWDRPWACLEGASSESSPKAINTISSRIDVFLVGEQGQLWWTRRSEDTQQWVGTWQSLGKPGY